MTQILNVVNQFVWGFPALVLILSVGILLSIRTGWAQFRLFPAATRGFFAPFFKKDNSGGMSPYRALCTALAATIGTGNLAGVAGAIAIGGPGAIFWMWVCAVFGMVTKFAEATLAVRYRIKDANGEFVGGPMYMVRQGMGRKWQPLAGIYCFFGVVAAFGVGSATQINAVLGGINSAVKTLGGREVPVVNLLIGIAFGVLSVAVLLGGAERIGIAAAFLVPFASAFYLILCGGVLFIRASSIPSAVSSIFRGAFCPEAVTGGVLVSVFKSLRVGASRGVFTNEAGMGTAAMAHGAARVDHPVDQGLMGIVEVFLDTIVICTMTALVILCSGIEIPYGTDGGIRITADAFSCIYGPWVNIPLAMALCCFAFATIIGWGLYGTRCAQFLFGEKVWKRFAVFQAFSVVLGAVLRTETVWSLSETANGLMAIPNLIILVYLSPELVRLTKEHIGRRRVYENIRQGKSVSTFSNAKVSPLCGEGKK